jgi:hypothetical protein
LRTHTHKPTQASLCAVAATHAFFCRLLTHIAAHLFFVNKKIKELQANTPSRKKSPTHRRKLNNIMNLIVFFSLAHAGHANTQEKKSYKGIMLNSQQRNVKKNNAQPTGSFNYFFCQSREEIQLRF